MPRYLIDTHVLVWSQEQPKRLGKKTRELLLDEASTVLLSAVSALEIARLGALARLRFKAPPVDWFQRACAALGVQVVDVTPAIGFEAYGLAGDFHKDPADRVIVATARVTQASLITADERLLNYGFVRSFDARR